MTIGAMALEDVMRAKLTAAFAPDHLNIENDSARHAGHAGAREAGNTGESHFNIAITAAAFSGVGRVARQRLVYAVLKAELAGPVHALSVKARAPGE
jgi:BolA protein